MTNPSTVWTQLALPNPASGSIPFVATDNQSIITDVTHFNYSATTQTLTVENLVVSTLVTLPSALSFAAGGSATTYRPEGIITKQLAPAATGANTNETVLQVYNLPADVLNANGNGIEIEAWGSFAANANGKTIKLYFGTANVLLNSSVLTTSGATWFLRATIYRTAANTQICFAGLSPGSNTPPVTIPPASQQQAQPDNAIISIYVTGQNAVASAGDIVCNTMIIKMLA